ncbi:MAG: hypothetical protein P4L91_06700 [Burkholderiaceae bacterium]|nr:hypothetical protein [Burkholderiaceae bacterium]
MEARVKNALESVFAKLKALSPDEFKTGLSKYEDSELALSLAGFFTFCKKTLNKVNVRIETLEHFEMPNIEYREVVTALAAANDHLYLMAA